MYLNPKQVEDLHVSIHRLASQKVQGCTLAQVKKVVRLFHDGNWNRAQFALLIYWQLAENRDEECSFLDRLQNRVEIDQEGTKKEPEQPRSVRDYWTKERNPNP